MRRRVWGEDGRWELGGERLERDRGGAGKSAGTYGIPQAGASSRTSPSRARPVKHVLVIRDGETLSAGTLSVRAHFTFGHTPGGTSWTWVSCERDRCLNMVYADSLSAVSADDFRFSHNTTYPRVLQDFAKSFDVVSALPCDILLTPHPNFSDVMGRLHERENGNPDAFINPSACGEYVEAARAGLKQRLAQEAKSEHP